MHSTRRASSSQKLPDTYFPPVAGFIVILNDGLLLKNIHPGSKEQSLPSLHVFARIVFWIAVYLVIALSPLALAIFGDRPPARSFWIELGVGLGLVGYAMLGLQFATTSRFRWVTPYFGTDAEVGFHRVAGILAVALVLAHPAVLFLAEPKFLDYLNPWSNLPRAAALTVVLFSLVLLVALSLWRLSFRLNYEWWRLIHGLLAVIVILIGLAHALQVEHYVAGRGKRVAWVGGAIIPLGLWVAARAIKPMRSGKRPWRVVAVRPDCPDVYRLILEPDGHAGIRFEPGQYAWLTIHESPWTLQQHPFSFLSSSEAPDRLEFGIKALGDFTRSIADVPVGTRAYLEGPYGSFSLDPKADRAVFVVGGIGITPVMSILQTCRDRGDRRQFLLINGNPNWEEVPFREELDSLTEDLKLKITHVLTSPTDDWDGKTGYVTPELLDRHLASFACENTQYFTCGPDPMMDVVENALLARGIPQARFVAERFAFV